MSAAKIPATRSNLVRARRQKRDVDRGIELLEKKREALVSELFSMAKPASDLRVEIEERARSAYRILLSALAHHGRDQLAVIGRPARDLVLEIEGGEVWGVKVGEVTKRPAIRRTLGARGTAPALTGPIAAETSAEFEQLAELLLDAAPREMAIRRLSEALANTSRRVNTLEERTRPELDRRIQMVRRTLEEREREEHARLRHLIKKRVRPR